MSKLKKALEKAKEARGTDFPVSEGIGEPLRPILKPKSPVAEKGRSEVKVTYSKTKVQKIDPNILKKNKIFSLFQENKMTDQVNTLRTQILHKLKEIGGNSLLVTSAYPGEGKTFTTINLGVSIAQELDRTVLLVDADLRHPTLHHYDFANDFLGIDISRGLSDYLLSQVELPELLLNPGIHKLTILPAGRPLPNSAELLGSDRMEQLITEIKNRYRSDRVVLIDGPAILTCTDPLVLARYVDGVLLVVETERSTPDDLKRVMALLKDKPILGTILNKVK